MTEQQQQVSPGYGKTVDRPFDETLQQVEAALEKEGFGIMTRIDVKQALKQKIDVDFYPYQILGACMPRMAHKALTAAPQVGVLLPCNVVVREVEPGTTRVEVINTAAMTQMFPGGELDEVAATVGSHLDNVLGSI
jgi:uncharacterized protein (DUF302 family)